MAKCNTFICCILLALCHSASTLAKAPAKYKNTQDHKAVFVKDAEKQVRRWCNDFVGWNQALTHLGNVSPDLIRIQEGEGGVETLRLLLALKIPFSPGNSLSMPPTPKVSEQARNAFLRLLNQSELIERPPSMGYHLMVAGDRYIRYPKMWRKQALDKMRKDQHFALQLADGFEAYVKRFPEEPYLGGYAAYYGMQIRLQWEESIPKINKGLDTLEKQFAPHKVVPIMTRWSRILLHFLEKKPNVQAELSVFVRDNADKGYYVVDFGKEMLTENTIADYESVTLKYFITPIRKPDILPEK